MATLQQKVDLIARELQLVRSERLVDTVRAAQQLLGVRGEGSVGAQVDSLLAELQLSHMAPAAAAPVAAPAAPAPVASTASAAPAPAPTPEDDGVDQARVQELDGDLAVELGVAGRIDHAHAPGADALEDRVEVTTLLGHVGPRLEEELEARRVAVEGQVVVQLQRRRRRLLLDCFHALLSVHLQWKRKD